MNPGSTKSINYAIAVVHMAQKAGYKALVEFALHELKDENVTEVSSIGQHYFKKRLGDEMLTGSDLKWLSINLEKFEVGVYYFELFRNDGYHAWINIITEKEIWYVGIYEGSREIAVGKFDKEIYARNFTAMVNGSVADYKLIFQAKEEVQSVGVKFLRFTRSDSYGV